MGSYDSFLRVRQRKNRAAGFLLALTAMLCLATPRLYLTYRAEYYLVLASMGVVCGIAWILTNKPWIQAVAVIVLTMALMVMLWDHWVPLASMPSKHLVFIPGLVVGMVLYLLYHFFRRR